MSSVSPSIQGSSSSRSRLHSIGEFLKGLGSSDKPSQNGQAPKRRGPKPDTKPAMTRRQELNRKAQRTHRQRKENYIKVLEEQNMQLKEVYTESIKERDTALEENQKLKELLINNNIPLAIDHQDMLTDQLQIGGAGTSVVNEHQGSSPQALQQQPSTQQYYYEQVGIDFVLALEEACRDHIQHVCVKAQQNDGLEINGHATMLTCPPSSHIDQFPEEPYPYQINFPETALMKLSRLSQQLPLDGEITPIMAFNIILNHPRFADMTAADMDSIKANLRTKTRCYGFGAVLEEFEVQDAINAVLEMKTV